MQVHAPSVLRWVHNACFDTTKIHVNSFERCIMCTMYMYVRMYACTQYTSMRVL